MSFAVTLALPNRDRSVTPKCNALETPIIKGVTLHRDTSNPLRGIEVSRQVWTSLVRPLALAFATTTLVFEGRHVTALTARSACGGRDAASATRRGNSCQSPAMLNGRSRMYGGTFPGAPVGNKNAVKRGRYTAETIARRREISFLIRVARQVGRRDDVLRQTRSP